MNKEISINPCIICDIDGTLVVDDKPVLPIVGLVNMYRENGYSIFIFTERSQCYRDETYKWLKDKGIKFDYLIMRPNDKRHTSDNVIKFDMLRIIREGGYQPQLAIDDHDQVVKMWRDNGLTCLQVAEGNF